MLLVLKANECLSHLDKQLLSANHIRIIAPSIRFVKCVCCIHREATSEEVTDHQKDVDPCHNFRLVEVDLEYLLSGWIHEYVHCKVVLLESSLALFESTLFSNIDVESGTSILRHSILVCRTEQLTAWLFAFITADDLVYVEAVEVIIGKDYVL